MRSTTVKCHRPTDSLSIVYLPINTYAFLIYGYMFHE